MSTDEDKISSIYQQGKEQGPPAHLDDVILKAAHETVEQTTDYLVDRVESGADGALADWRRRWLTVLGAGACLDAAMAVWKRPRIDNGAGRAGVVAPIQRRVGPIGIHRPQVVERHRVA